MAKTYEMTGRLADVTRIANSFYGNPRYKVTIVTSGTGDHSPHTGDDCQGDHLFRTLNTAADASFNYEVGNPRYRENDLVIVTIGGRGTIVDMRPADQ